jgi:hypothetical protein
MYNETELDQISKKNLGQLLTTLESLNCSEAVVAITKSFFWKNLDDIKMTINK